MSDNFSSKLKHYRIRGGMSQNALAKAVGINPSYINKIEKGGRDAPKRDVILAISRVLQLKDYERDELLLSANYSPELADIVDLADPTLRIMAEILDDEGRDIDDSIEQLTRLLRQRREKGRQK